MLVHHEIKPIKVWALKALFYDMDSTVNGLEKCEIFSVSSYKGFRLSFNIKVLSTQSVFCDIPIWGLQCRESLDPMSSVELCYDVCPDWNIAVNDFDHLNGPCHVYFKELQSWSKGQYLFTLDWYQDNLNCHFIQLDNGRLCFMPTHKVWFSGGVPPKTPVDYKKKRYSN